MSGEAAEDGHCFLPQTELVEQAVQRLSLQDHHLSRYSSLYHVSRTLVILKEIENTVVCYQPAFLQSEQNL